MKSDFMTTVRSEAEKSAFRLRLRISDMTSDLKSCVLKDDVGYVGWTIRELLWDDYCVSFRFINDAAVITLEPHIINTISGTLQEARNAEHKRIRG